MAGAVNAAAVQRKSCHFRVVKNSPGMHAAAADLVWASVHAASTLYLIAKERQPDPVGVETLRERALQCIYTPSESEMT